MNWTVAARNVVFIVGLACVSYGLYAAYKPLGIVAFGAALVWLSMLLAEGK